MTSIEEHMVVFRSLLPLAVMVSLLSGCAGFAEGVTTAVIQSQLNSEDTRGCEVRGAAFDGLSDRFPEQEGLSVADSQHQIKLLMVHGIGDHEPGYATRLAEKLAASLKMDQVAERHREIALLPPEGVQLPERYSDLGVLRVSRFLSSTTGRELLFYELSWSSITSADKRSIAWDTSGEYSSRRASLNQQMKAFFNSHIPDPMIYLGEARQAINIAVVQSMCWMFSGDWADLPASGDAPVACQAPIERMQRVVQEDDFGIVTHSLGSRIAVDSVQYLAEATVEGEVESPVLTELRNKRLPIYMLANQLPLLQLGRKKPETVAVTEQYCPDQAPLRHQRLVSELQIIAFSDPNDVLSYAIPPGYAEQQLDSRMCPTTVNVNIEVAHTLSVPVLGTMANPADAHNNYHADDRVIGLIAHGIGRDTAAPIVQERCSWIETLRD